MRKQLFDKSFSKVFEAAKMALKKMDAQIEYSSRGKGTIVATTGFSIFSWGEEIQVFINERSSTKTEVVVKSNSDKQLFDWGKSKKNEDEFFVKLITILKRS